MFNWFVKALKDRRGNAMVEFALVLPVILLILGGLVDIGRLFYQADALEKALRDGATFAARSQLPLSQEAIEKTANLIKTGTLSGNGALLLPGWQNGSGELDIETVSVPVMDPLGQQEMVPVIRLRASVPAQPLLPGIWALFGQENFTIEASHEQAYLGN